MMKEENIKTITLDHLRCSKPKKILFNTVCKYETTEGLVKEKYNSLTKNLQYTLKGKPVNVRFYDEPEHKQFFFDNMNEFLDFLT